MATGLTQQADIPRQHSSSGAAALMVSSILKRFNEMHPARQGERRHSQIMDTECVEQKLYNIIFFFFLSWFFFFPHNFCFLLFQVSVQYSLRFTSWWPTWRCRLALVSSNNKLRNCTATQLESLWDHPWAEEKTAQSNNYGPRDVKNPSMCPLCFSHWTSDLMCNRWHERE